MDVQHYRDYQREYKRTLRARERAERAPGTCRECGGPFEMSQGPRRYCTAECYRAAHLRRRREREYRPDPIVCAQCGGPVAYKCGRRRYCSDACQLEHAAGISRWRIKGLWPDSHGFDERCAICGSVENLRIDHDHRCCPGERACGRCVRGFLCHTHNVALGMFKDDPEMVARALTYLTTGIGRKDTI
jgi:hypothetical protein